MVAQVSVSPTPEASPPRSWDWQVDAPESSDGKERERRLSQIAPVLLGSSARPVSGWSLARRYPSGVSEVMLSERQPLRRRSPGKSDEVATGWVQVRGPAGRATPWHAARSRARSDERLHGRQVICEWEFSEGCSQIRAREGLSAAALVSSVYSQLSGLVWRLAHQGP